MIMDTRHAKGGILFLSATLGAGHHSAAVAIGEALRRMAPEVPTREVDYFDYVNRSFNHLVRQAYIFSVRHWPWAYEAFYRSTGQIAPHSAFQRFLNTLGRREIERLVGDEDPRAVVSTFPTPAGVVSALREMGRTDAPSMAVITDYTVHSQWLHEGIDRFYVGTEEMAEEMAGRGIPRAKILVSGIPVHPAFADPVDAEAVRRRFGIGDGPVILLMAGAYGMISGFADVVGVLAEKGPAATYVSIAGHDAQLKAAVDQVAQRGGHPVVSLGYTDEVAQLMGVADVLVSKAGGLTTSEAMARGLPMAIFRPIPGQEMVNTGRILDAGAGFRAPTTDDLVDGLRAVMAPGGALAGMAERARSLGRPRSSYDIARDILEHASRGTLGSALGNEGRPSGRRRMPGRGNPPARP